MLSISRNVRLSVCMFVCLFTFEVPFNGLFASTSWSRMFNILKDSESLGKSNGNKWSHIWIFLFGSGLKSPLLILHYKLLWKPRFSMDYRPLVKGHIANFFISLDVFEFLRFGWFFSVFQKNLVFGYSWSTLLWYRCYYPHRSRDALSPVCGIFFWEAPLVS